MKSFELLQIIGDVDARFILETRRRPEKSSGKASRRLLLCAALLALGTVIAFAAVESRLIQSLFRNGETPTRSAVEHLVQPGTGATSDGAPAASLCDFRLNEYLLDGDRLYVSYSLRNPTEETLIYRLRFRAEGMQALAESPQRDALLGGSIDGLALPAEITCGAAWQLERDAGEALNADMTVFVLRPAADFVASDTSSAYGTPVILWERMYSDRPVVLDYCYGYEVTRLEDDFPAEDGDIGEIYSRSFNHDDLDAKKEALSAAGDSRLAHVRALEQLGYVELVEQRTCPMRLENGAKQAVVEVGRRFDIGIGELEVESLTVQAVRTRLAMRFMPNEAWRQAADCACPHFLVYLNGSSEPRELITGSAREEEDAIDFDVESTGVMLYEYLWSSSDEPIRSVRLQPVDPESGRPVGRDATLIP